jgi:uncharacterized protein (DUF58 family)
MKRFVLLGVLAYGLFLLGLAFFLPRLIWMAIPLIVYLIAALLAAPASPQLQVSRALSVHRVTKDTPVTVTLRVTNEGPALEEVMIQDLVPERLEIVGGVNQCLMSLDSGQYCELHYQVRGKRGAYQFTSTRIIASDLLGIRQRTRELETSSTLLVLPDITPMRPIAIRPLRTHGFAGPIPSRRGGTGVEFHGVREYHRGDPLRWINWRLTARRPRFIFTNEFEQERIANVGLILDGRRRTNIAFEGDSLLEYGVSATASLSKAFLDAGNRVGMLIYGWYLDWTYPGYGRVQQERILRALAHAQPGDSLVFERLQNLPVRFFPAGSQLVVVSPLCGDDLDALQQLQMRGYELLVVSPNPIHFEVSHLAANAEIDLAFRVARLNRNLLLGNLRRLGIPVVDWQVDTPLDQGIQASLGRRPYLLHNRTRLARPQGLVVGPDGGTR